MLVHGGGESRPVSRIRDVAGDGRDCDVGTSDVGTSDVGTSDGGRQLPGHCLQSVGAPRIDDERPAPGCQCTGGCPAEPTGCSSDECDRHEISFCDCSNWTSYW